MPVRASVVVLFVALGSCEAYNHGLYRVYADGGAATDAFERDTESTNDAIATSDTADGNEVADVTAADVMVGPQPDVGVDVPCTARVVINELEAGTQASTFDEFVELHDTTSCPASIGGWVLRGRAASTDATAIIWLAPADLVIPANGYLVVAGNAFAGATGWHFLASSASAASGVPDMGALGLFDTHGNQVDGVGYSVGAGSMLTEGAPFPTSLPDGQSLQRLPDGADTDDNASDFQLTATPSPGAAN